MCNVNVTNLQMGRGTLCRDGRWCYPGHCTEGDTGQNRSPPKKTHIITIQNGNSIIADLLQNTSFQKDLGIAWMIFIGVLVYTDYRYISSTFEVEERMLYHTPRIVGGSVINQPYMYYVSYKLHYECTYICITLYRCFGLLYPRLPCQNWFFSLNTGDILS